MTLCVMKVYFRKQEANIISYRDYRTFSNVQFQNHLNNELDLKNICTFELKKFLETTLEILNLHAPIKKRYVRANQTPFMDNTIQKEIMTRSRLRNKYLRTRLESDKIAIAYTRQRNYCVNLSRKNNFFTNVVKELNIPFDYNTNTVTAAYLF